MTGTEWMNRAWSWRRVAAGVVAVLTLVVAEDMARADDKLPDARKMLEKSIEVRGGRATFEKFQTCVSKGKLKFEAPGQEAQEYPIERYEQAPNKFRQTLTVGPGQLVEYGCTGKICWSLHVNRVEFPEGEERELQLRQARLNSFLHWQEDYTSVECVGKEDADGHSCYKILMIPDLGYPRTLYLDRKKGLPRRIETTRKETTQTGQEIELPVVADIGDYRTVNGVLMPHKITQRVLIPDSKEVARVMTWEWESIAYDVDVPKQRLLPPTKVMQEYEFWKALHGHDKDKDK